MPGPEKEFEYKLTINFTADQWDYLQKWALKFKLPMAALIRDALELFIENNQGVND